MDARGRGRSAGGIGRVTDRRIFEALRAGSRAHVGGVSAVFTVAPGSATGPVGNRALVAFAVGRRTGGAVTRNRIRRRLRSALRLEADSLEPGAYLIGAGSGVADLEFGELRRRVREAMAAAVRRSGPAPADGIESPVGPETTDRGHE